MTDFEVAVARYLIQNPKWGQNESEAEVSKDEENSSKITK